MKRRRILIPVSILLMCCTVSGLVFAMASRSVDQENDIYGKLSDACLGYPVPDAAAFSMESDIRPIIGMKWYGAGYSAYNYPIPVNALASSISETQLVFCLDEEEKTLLESCPYHPDNDNNPSRVVERYQYQQKIKLFQAKTGILMAEGLLLGDAPRECQDEEYFPRKTKILTLTGEKVSDVEIQTWLRPFIMYEGGN